MNYKIVTKGVSFNILDPDQKVLLEHAMQRKNFSSYVKRLIQRDMDNGAMQSKSQPIQRSNLLNDELMRGLL